MTFIYHICITLHLLSSSFFCSLSLYSVYISYLKSQSIFHMYIGQCSSVKKLIRGVEWSSNNDISLLHQGIPFMDHAHMYRLKLDTVTFIFQSGKRTSEDSLLLPVPNHFAQISLLEILIPAWHPSISPAMSLPVGTWSSGPVEAIKAPV